MGEIRLVLRVNLMNLECVFVLGYISCSFCHFPVHYDIIRLKLR